jgi:quercetin dioxygenase-like cupin family protein
MADAVRVGNARAEGGERRGWFVGHFLPAGDLRATEAVEVKWGIHPAGEARAGWVQESTATSLSILLRGRFRLRFPDREVLLASEGDYALWAPDVPHHWQAEEDSVVLTVRWPSRPSRSATAVP